MNGREKSDPVIVAVKSLNKTGEPAAEAMERRVGAEENARRQRTRRTQSRESVSQSRNAYGRPQGFAVTIRGGSRMRESRTSGSVRGDRGNPVPYRDTSSIIGVARRKVRRQRLQDLVGIPYAVGIIPRIRWWLLPWRAVATITSRIYWLTRSKPLLRISIGKAPGDHGYMHPELQIFQSRRRASPIDWSCKEGRTMSHLNARFSWTGKIAGRGLALLLGVAISAASAAAPSVSPQDGLRSFYDTLLTTMKAG